MTTADSPAMRPNRRMPPVLDVSDFMSEDACQIGGRGRNTKQFIGDDDAAAEGRASADAFQAMQQSSRMLAVARASVGAVSWVSKTAPSGRWRGGRWRRCGWTSAVRRAQARGGAVVQQQQPSGCGVSVAARWAAAPARTAGPQRATLRTRRCQSLQLAEFAAEASGVSVARYQFVQPGRGQQGQALRQIP